MWSVGGVMQRRSEGGAGGGPTGARHGGAPNGLKFTCCAGANWLNSVRTCPY